MSSPRGSRRISELLKSWRSFRVLRKMGRAEMAGFAGWQTTNNDGLPHGSGARWLRHFPRHQEFGISTLQAEASATETAALQRFLLCFQIPFHASLDCSPVDFQAARCLFVAPGLPIDQRRVILEHFIGFQFPVPKIR